MIPNLEPPDPGTTPPAHTAPPVVHGRSNPGAAEANREEAAARQIDLRIEDALREAEEWAAAEAQSRGSQGGHGVAALGDPLRLEPQVAAAAVR